MKNLVYVTVIGLLLVPRAHAIDFTAHFADLVEDGFPIRRMYFTEGARRIYYRPSPNWSGSGDAEAATFKPKDSEQAVVRIENAPAGNARIPFDKQGLATLRRIAGGLMPPDAAQVSQTSEAVNPVVLQGWTSFEIAFDYVQSGRHFSRSILFLNLDAVRQIHFIVDAPPEEFEPLHKTVYRTLASWYEPAPAPAAP